MSNYNVNPFGEGLRRLWNGFVRNRQYSRGAAWGAMILGALLSFEIFNFSTTQYALHDMLGELAFGGMRWASVLAVAFCGIDFAGIARIFTPEQGRDEPVEVWYLFGAWVLAAAFNAALTWWGVSVAIAQNGGIQGTASLSSATMTKAVPIFVAAMVWLIRLLIIGTFSLAGDRLFTTAQVKSYSSNYSQPRSTYQNSAPTPRPQYGASSANMRPASQINRPINAAPAQTNDYPRPAPKPTPSTQTSFVPPEPTYHPVYEARRAENSERRYNA
ncbi:MAG: hypothetical protein LC099_11550 [Anaerolineales bacterium]|nr:hypothetical protein [Anaerolineales bacterium]